MTKDSINTENVYALVVGIEKYKGGSKWDLNGPAQDALKFANWLLERNVKPDHIFLFLAPLDENLGVLEEARARGLSPDWAGRHEIDLAIRDQLISKDIQGDILHVFWGGHGFVTTTDRTTRRLFFADTDNTNKLNLDFDSLAVALSTFAHGSGFKHQNFWIDACANVYSQELYATMGVETAGETFGRNGIQGKAEQFIFFAAAVYKVAMNDSAKGTGRFSRAVLDELAGKSLLPDMKALAEQIKANFREQKQSEPVYLWSKGRGAEEVIDNLNQEITSKDVLQKISSEEICQALAKAFPSKILLERMLRHGMGEQLDLIVPTADSVENIIFNLLSWAENNERVLELIQAAYKANSRKSELRDIAKSLGIQNV